MEREIMRDPNFHKLETMDADFREVEPDSPRLTPQPKQEETPPVSSEEEKAKEEEKPSRVYNQREDRHKVTDLCRGGDQKVIEAVAKAHNMSPSTLKQWLNDEEWTEKVVQERLAAVGNEFEEKVADLILEFENKIRERDDLIATLKKEIGHLVYMNDYNTVKIVEERMKK